MGLLSEESKKRGRPDKKGGKEYRCQLRLSLEDKTRLDYVAEKTGKNISDILREAIKMQYNIAVHHEDSR